MSRALCSRCERPQLACICSFITKTVNQTPVVILQHPSEVKQTKGSVVMLAQSLSDCQVIVGEDFSNNVQVAELMAQYDCALLYPSEHAQVLTHHNAHRSTSAKPPCIILLDGTWKKAYRMYMLSTNLHQLPHICLPEDIAQSGQYVIRKVKKKHALSTLEACCYALAIVESKQSVQTKVSAKNAGAYQVILEQFARFNQFQLSFIPEKGQ